MMVLGLIPSAQAEEDLPRVRLETNYGMIVLELDSQAAPKTVENFLRYVRDGFYDRTVFHRVIEGFMIQGGGLTTDMKKKATQDPIMNEADNQLQNLRGTIAMARTGDPHSATSQFFINTVDNSYLDHQEKTAKGWGYCVFGKVVEGIDVVDTIEKLPTTSRNGRRDVPAEPVVIQKAIVIE
jgi:peptidyl-prolyl cis-trans isomerase B (cyclophilin B)